MTRNEAKVIWDGYRSEFRHVAWMLPVTAGLMVWAGVLSWIHGLHIQAALFGCLAGAIVLLIDCQVRMSAARRTVRDLLATYEPIGEDD